MTGLDLEAFLRLTRASGAFWLGTGGVAALLGLSLWAFRNRAPLLRRCLVFSLASHVGLVVLGGPEAIRWLAPGGRSLQPGEQRPETRVSLAREASVRSERKSPDEKDWQRNAAALESLEALRVVEPPSEPAPVEDSPDPIVARIEAPSSLAPDLAPQPDLPEPMAAQPRSDPTSSELPELHRDASADLEVLSRLPEPGATPETSSPMLPELDGPADALASIPVARRTAPPRIGEDLTTPGPEPDPAPSERGGIEVVEPVALSSASVEELGSRGSQEAPVEPTGPSLPELDGPGPTNAARETGPELLAMRARPDTRSPIGRFELPSQSVRADSPALPAGPSGDDRPLPSIPEVYRSRVAPNRTALALAGGASRASEEAVDRALDWLARHQDADGRWNAGSRRSADGRAVRGEASHTSHCPPGDVCAGDSYYWEADTAVTGLALLAFLGAGHTSSSGPHADAVARGLGFLVRIQKPDGDLRGASQNVGMYCHAIATLALCEGYALTGDEQLRRPVEKAVRFLVDARSGDGMAWRYKPGDRFGGDTSILGWVVMVLKSAQEVGVDVPEGVRRGAGRWLTLVASGTARGLAIYRPGEGYPVTPTMTAEAWACRQFLGVGGPGPASDEAATYLLQHGPDRDPLNLYYWYYATLAMYQHGGDAWSRWNARVRDQLIQRQVRGGHADGSWDPAQCKDKHDRLGGRVYATALSALTLEVYYRYLRLYATVGTDPER
jgi:hypothetical protein